MCVCVCVCIYVEYPHLVIITLDVYHRAGETQLEDESRDRRRDRQADVSHLRQSTAADLHADASKFISALSQLESG